MLDPQRLRQDLAATAVALAKRGFILDQATLHSLELQRKLLQQESEQLQAQRNAGAKAIGLSKGRGEDITDAVTAMDLVNDALKIKEAALNAVQHKSQAMMALIPNILADDVPEGLTEQDNLEISRWGEPPVFDFEAKDHVQLGENLKSLSGSAGAAIAGARFTVLQGDIAKLHRALAQYMLELQTNAGYIEMNVPTIVNEKSLFGTSNLPKDADGMFKLHHDQEWYLSPTAEVSLTNLVAGRILDIEQLPLNFCAYALCYRSEAGAYGKDTRGFIRQHQFEKVELVHITQPEDSPQVHETMVANAEAVLQQLQLPYRKMVLCAGDTGFGAQKTYDLEVWLPGQNAYREISSCSNYGDFAARRMGARFRRPGVKKPELVHTLNGSGLAIGRTLVAVLENYQQADGSVRVPEVLIDFMGKSVLEPAVFAL